MKTLDNSFIENHSIASPGASLRLKLAMVVGWAVLTFLLAVALAVQPAQAQEELGEPLPDSITVTRSVERGRKAITFHVNEPHSLFRYYDRIGTSWDRSGGSCYKNRVWFEYYLANGRDDTEPIRQSHSYTFRQREEGAKVCILVVFGDWRDGGGGGNPNGPFSFDADQTLVIDPPEEEVRPKENNTDETEQTQDEQAEDNQQPPQVSESETTPENHKYPTSQPLITSRPIVAPPAESTEPDQSPEPRPEPDSAPQEDQGHPVVEPEAPDATPDETSPLEIEVEVVGQVDDITAAGPPDSTQTDQSSNSETGSNLRNTRAVLWGIVAAMTTLLLLGSFVFRPKDRD